MHYLLLRRLVVWLKLLERREDGQLIMGTEKDRLGIERDEKRLKMMEMIIWGGKEEGRRVNHPAPPPPVDSEI